MDKPCRHRCYRAPVAVRFGRVSRMSATEIDFYELLEVARDCRRRDDQVRLSQAGDEVPPGPQSGRCRGEAKFKAISAAYECLKDPQKRAAYDRYGHAAFQQGMGGGGGGRSGGPISAISAISSKPSSAARSAAAAADASAAPRGADLRYDMQITLEEAFHGKSTEIEVEVSASLRPLRRHRRRARHRQAHAATCATATARSARSRASS